ncbi:MAG: hypothetical protein HQ453_09550 [Actinobacteria bacterium]|nr:hypothetical protein [Actinomycetota bacterium]
METAKRAKARILDEVVRVTGWWSEVCYVGQDIVLVAFAPRQMITSELMEIPGRPGVSGRHRAPAPV